MGTQASGQKATITKLTSPSTRVWSADGMFVDLMCNAHCIASRKTFATFLEPLMTNLAITHPNLILSTTRRAIGAVSPYDQTRNGYKQNNLIPLDPITIEVLLKLSGSSGSTAQHTQCTLDASAVCARARFILGMNTTLKFTDLKKKTSKQRKRREFAPGRSGGSCVDYLRLKSPKNRVRVGGLDIGIPCCTTLSSGATDVEIARYWSSLERQFRAAIVCVLRKIELPPDVNFPRQSGKDDTVGGKLVVCRQLLVDVAAWASTASGAGNQRQPPTDIHRTGQKLASLLADLTCHYLRVGRAWYAVQVDCPLDVHTTNWDTTILLHVQDIYQTLLADRMKQLVGNINTPEALMAAIRIDEVELRGAKGTNNVQSEAVRLDDMQLKQLSEWTGNHTPGHLIRAMFTRGIRAPTSDPRLLSCDLSTDPQVIDVLLYDLAAYTARILYDPITGRRMRCQTTIGVSYVCMLNKYASTSFKARSSGSIDVTTRQPACTKGSDGATR
jgi:hypothetical protein